MKHNIPQRGGFAARGMIVAVGIVLLLLALLALLVPSMQGHRTHARRNNCKNNLKQLGIALHNYHETYTIFPSGYVSVNNSNQLGWGTMILPFMEQDNLYKTIKNETEDFGTDWNANLDAAKTAMTVLEGFICPSDPMEGINTRWVVKAGGQLRDTHVGKSNYVANKNMFYQNSDVRMRDITDGSSNTFFLGERDTKTGYGGIWIGIHRSGEEEGAYTESSVLFDGLGSDGDVPYSINSKATEAHSKNSISSRHKGSVHMLFGDGRVKFMSESMDVEIYRALSTYKANDVLCGEF